MSDRPSHAWAHVIAEDVRAGRTSAEQITREALNRAHARKDLNAFLQVFDDAAIAHAKWVDAQVAARSGTDLALAGVPIAIKDNICVGPDAKAADDLPGYGGRTTCASRMLEGYESPFTATAVMRLIRAGAIIIGKTNLDEFAMGSSGENSAFGPTCNPWDASRVPGGSSSGSAAAVAARIVPLALGSDTGGSIRQPAAFTGTVGFKPTYGRVSRYGLVAYASSLDQIGPVATNVADAALAFGVIHGEDARDATSARRDGFAMHDALNMAQPPARVGVIRQGRSEANHPAVREALDQVVLHLLEHGTQIVNVDLPMLDAAIAAYYVIAPAEAASNLARYDGVRYGRRASLKVGEGLDVLYARSRAEGFGPEVQRRIMLGTHVLSSGYFDAYYLTAARARRKLLEQFNAAFESGDTPCDALLMPTTPGPAFAIGAKTDPMSMYLEDIYTVAVNLAGLPAISVPVVTAATESGRSLPVGMQLIGRAFDESGLLRVAAAIEQWMGPAPTPPGV